MKRTFLMSIISIFLFCVSGCGATLETQYSSNENWAILSSDIVQDADVFLICPTVDMGTESRYNMSLEDAETKVSFVGALNMETGIYNEVCNVFAPYYRQITISAYEMDVQSRYLDIAYQDVRAAFIYYYQNYNQGRPFIIAGFSQGAQLGLMLMEDLFDDTQYSDNMIAAYLIGWGIDDERLKKSPWIQMATGETDTGCVISFNSESVETTSSFVVPAGMKTLAINPLNWVTDSTPADAFQNLGACFTDYSGTIKKELPQLTGAYLDSSRGTLKVPDVSPEDYPPVLAIFSPGEYHLYDYQFFFRNLQKNVADRTAAFCGK